MAEMIEKLGFGTMKLPLKDANDDTSIDIEEVIRMVDCYMQAGGRYFDLATPYHKGAAEKAFRCAVADRYPRESYLVTGKLSHWLINNEEGCRTFFSNQLENCGIEYFDYYMYHAVNRSTFHNLEKIGGVDFIRRMKETGKIRHIGCQFHDDAAVLDQLLEAHPEIEFIHLMFNYAEWDSVCFEIAKCCDVINKHGKWIVAMFPLMSGVLARNLPKNAGEILRSCRNDLSLASWAVRWAASQKGVGIVLPDASSLGEMKDNIHSLGTEGALTETEGAALKKARACMSDRMSEKCTGCGRCEEVCPENINIAKVINLFMDQELYGFMPSLHKSNYYEASLLSHGRASSCIACGRCSNKCPEQIDIPGILRKASVIFDNEIYNVSGYTRLPIGETERVISSVV